MSKSEHLAPLFESEKPAEDVALQVFVYITEFYSHPYTVVIVAENEEQARKLLEQARTLGFRNEHKTGFYGSWRSDQILKIDPRTVGVYTFEAPGDGSFR